MDAHVHGWSRWSGRGDTRRLTPWQASRERPPIDGVERDADGERRRLHELAGGVRHPEREHELIELRQEEGGDRRRDEVPAAAEQRRAPEHDGRDGRQKIVVALVGGRLVDDAREWRFRRIRRETEQGASGTRATEKSS